MQSKGKYEFKEIVAKDFLKKFFGPVAAQLDRLIRCLDSSLVECPPATQAVGFRIPVNTCLSRDAFLKHGESLGQVSP